MSNEITAYKGFDQNLKCMDFKYAVGQTYVHEGKVEVCKSGFHACENPLDVFGYYPPADSRFAIVKMAGEISCDGKEDSKIAAGKITIEAEIKLPELIDYGVKWILSKIDWANRKTNTGDQSAATNTGNRSAATNTGYQSAATNTGDQSAATNTGYQSAATNTGDQSAATNTGYQSAATNTGDQSAATNTGNRSAATNTGYQSAATNTGDQSAATNTGYQSAATNTGNRSAATNTGYRSAAEVAGENSVACALGGQSKAKAAEGGAIVCVYRDGDGNLIHIRASKVGENDILPDVWYTLDESGNFVAAE